MNTRHWSLDGTRWVVPAALGILVGAAAALLKPWQAALAVMAPTLLAVLVVGAWSRPAWGLAVLAVMMPFQFRLPFSRNWSLASGVALTGLLALMWLCGRLAAGKPRLVWMLPPGAAIMALAAGLSLFVAWDPMVGVKKLIYLSSFMLLFLLTLNLVRTPRHLQMVTRALVWAGCLAAVAGIAQFFAQFRFGTLQMLYIWKTALAPILEGPRAAEEFAANINWMLWFGSVPVMRALGPFMGPQDIAQFMAVCTPLALVGALAGGRALGVGRRALGGETGAADGTADGLEAPNAQRPTPNAFLALVPVLLMLVFLALTFSRQAWVGAIAMFPALLILGIGYRPFSARLGWLALLGAGIVVTLLVAMPTAGIASRFYSIFDMRERSNTERFETWRDGLDAVEAYPVMGTGVGNFFTAIGAPGPGAYTHNAYLDIWAETGPVGLIGFLLLLGWAWWSAARVFMDAREPALRAFGMAALGSLCWLCVLFVFDNMLYSARSGPAVWLLLGLLAAARRMTSPCTS